ncbi:hypothetical protein [Sphingobium bisphenolivorans]|uniref:hypothetical protein n=1 Tax=Sphingobium bisphenolivorans TaxID=1335760 RepID=UPI0003A15217|nr:hypothetical protein [Sphingobium bisphenolivorans]
MSSHISSTARRVALAFALIGTVAPAVAKTMPDPYVPTGKPVDCIPLQTIRNTDVRDDRTIDFMVNGNRIYRNILPNSCPSLGFERRFAYKTSLSQLCSVDIITVLYSSPSLMRGASCGLGKFQPMKKVHK